MPAWLLPAITAATGIAGAVGANKAANATEDAANRAYDVNLKIHEDNLAAQKLARDESMALAREFMERGLKGRTDATGSRTYFDEERGWVEELSPMQQMLLQMFEQEQMRQLGKSTQRIESSEQRNMRGAAQAEDVIAKELQRRQYDSGPRDSQPLAEMLFARGQQERNRVLDRNDNVTARTMLSQGNISPAQTYAAVSERAKATAEGASQDRIAADLAARQTVRGEQMQDRADGSKLFQQFMAPRSYSPQIGVQQPQAPTRTGDASNFGAQLVSAASQAPNAPMIEPNFAGANSIATKTNAITGGLNSLAGVFMQQQQTKQLADALKGL